MRYTLPNIFSLSRVIIAPIFLVLFLQSGHIERIVAVVLFIVAALTDYVDGWLARKYSQSSTCGTIIDPLADKILTSTAFVGFALLSLIAWWMVFVVLVRDVATTALRSYADSIGRPLITSWGAKAKTFAQMTFIIAVLVFRTAQALPLSAQFYDYTAFALQPLVVQSLMLLVTFITVWTGIEYFLDNRDILRPCYLRILRLARRRARRTLS
ncbi:MAG: CDP-diacylglycerol--glycerol-3-phosphate 3-phosphatidyltransferase [Bacteroidota bacterium]|nr:CDP-diacylglycerol--glycerol-3-phosphate 3-phosphatidyltransferase [Candidatus Kapabacteria bacterium]MDW8219266.1 CDP-diacylglycerol--glycerol-3-phosphate 3-phosphatidyltransferase [Bacteroidota bacterium]